MVHTLKSTDTEVFCCQSPTLCKKHRTCSHCHIDPVAYRQVVEALKEIKEGLRYALPQQDMKFIPSKLVILINRTLLLATQDGRA